MATNPIHQDFVATGSEDETIRLWRVKPDCSGITACHAISPKPDPWMKVTWSDNGKLLAGGCSDGTACVSKFLPEGMLFSFPLVFLVSPSCLRLASLLHRIERIKLTQSRMQ